MCLEYAAGIEYAQMHGGLNLKTLRIGLSQAHEELKEIIARNS